MCTNGYAWAMAIEIDDDFAQLQTFIESLRRRLSEVEGQLDMLHERIAAAREELHGITQREGLDEATRHAIALAAYHLR